MSTPARAEQRLVLWTGVAARLPVGTAPVGVGLGVFGLSSYVFLALGARQLSAAEFAALSTLWVLIYTGGPGVFLPFEQAIGRAIAIHRADRGHQREVLRTLLVSSVVALGALLVVAVAARSVITTRLFDGSTGTFVALLLAVVGMWAAYVTRGVFAGRGRYRSYGMQLAIEGVARVAAALVVIVVAGSLGGFALGLAAALLVSVALTLTGVRGGHRLPVKATVTTEDPAMRTQLMILAWMTLGGLMMQVLVNVAPVIAKVAPHQPPGAAGHYLGGLMLARLPLFLFAAVQAALLPGLAHKVADGDRAGLRRQLAVLFLLIGAAMGIFTAILAVAGPRLVDLMYGSGFQLNRSDLVLLAVGTGAAMLAMVAGSAVVAIGAPATAAVAWTASVVVLAAVLFVPGSLFLRLELSYLAGSAVALLGQLLALFHRARTATPQGAPA